MQLPCDVETAEDFRRYYASAYVGLRLGTSHINPAKPTGGTDGKISFKVLEKSPTGGYIWTDKVLQWKDLIEVCSFGIPKLGMCQIGGELAYGSMRGERNSNRGFTTERVFFTEFAHWYLRHKYGAGLPVISFNQDIIWQAYNPRYESVAGAWGRLQSGESVGVPLHENFGLYTKPDYKYPFLAYKKWTIGFAPNAYALVVGRGYFDYMEYVDRTLHTNVTGQ